ncbi:MAG TPA: hypothetical protein DCM67_08490, partial [Propionibacteriaceae bacterium]|nr:hypothetical protein [Propionibacteriaceae bacterium]
YQDGTPVLLIAGDEGITCRLQQQAEGTWRGSWLIYERMPVELIAVPESELTMTGTLTTTSPEPIDAVYTWVDGHDPNFRIQLERYMSGRADNANSGDARPSRYRSHDELRYSLRSLQGYAPWIRHVYLVTNGQVPVWLDETHPGITVVPHEAIFPDAGHLPTFNSLAIELHLHRIPGLSRRYLYFNDDLFFGRPVSPESYLTPSGVQKVYLEDWLLSLDLSAGGVLERAHAHTQHLLRERIPDQSPFRAIAHVPQIYDREWVAQVEALWPREIAATSASRFRTGTNVVLCVLYSHYLLSSPAYRTRHRAVVVRNRSTDYVLLMLREQTLSMLDMFDEIAFQCPKFLCVNDDLGDSEVADIVLEYSERFLANYFPEPSTFEKTDWLG